MIQSIYIEIIDSLISIIHISNGRMFQQVIQLLIELKK